MGTLSYNPEESLGYMTITANRLMSAHLRRRMRESGINLSADQWAILARLWDRGDLPQEELTRIACMDKAAMSRLLFQMESKGLIVRNSDARNARRKIIHATEKSFALREQYVVVAREVLRQALTDVEEQDCMVCMKVLQAVKQNLQ